MRGAEWLILYLQRTVGRQLVGECLHSLPLFCYIFESPSARSFDACESILQHTGV